MSEVTSNVHRDDITYFREKLQEVSKDLQSLKEYVTLQLGEARKEIREVRSYADEKIAGSEQRMIALQDVRDKLGQQRHDNLAQKVDALKTDLIVSVKNEGVQIREIIKLDQESRLREQQLLSNAVHQRFTDGEPYKAKIWEGVRELGGVKGMIAMALALAALVVSILMKK